MNFKKLSEVSYTNQPNQNANVIIEDNGNLKKTDLQMGITQEVEDRINNAQWKEETSTPLFSETVTVSDEYGSQLNYSNPITADTIVVTFDGVEYTCPVDADDGFYTYGGTVDRATNSIDYSEYPFCIIYRSDGNYISTENIGTHTVSVSAEITTYTEKFSKAVKSLGTLARVDNIDAADIIVAHFSDGELPLWKATSNTEAVLTINASGTTVTSNAGPTTLEIYLSTCIFTRSGDSFIGWQDTDNRFTLLNTRSGWTIELQTERLYHDPAEYTRTISPKYLVDFNLIQMKYYKFISDDDGNNEILNNEVTL